MAKVKTTIMIEEAVLRSAKKFAVDHDGTLSELIESSLRQRMDSSEVDRSHALQEYFQLVRERQFRSEGKWTRAEIHERADR